MRNLWDSFSLNTCNLNVGTISALQRLLQLKTILFLTHLFVFPRESKRVRSSYSSVFRRCSIYSNLLSSSFFFFSLFLFSLLFFNEMAIVRTKRSNKNCKLRPRTDFTISPYRFHFLYLHTTIHGRDSPYVTVYLLFVAGRFY